MGAALLAFPELFSLEVLSLGRFIGGLAGLPLFLSPLWFIPAIFLCYLFAPAIFMLYRRVGGSRFIIFNIALAALFTLMSQRYYPIVNTMESLLGMELPDRYALLYRNIFLGYLLLFSAGMMMPELLDRVGRRLNRGSLFWVSGLLMAALLVIDRRDRMGSHRMIELVELANFTAVYFFCLVAMAARQRLPLRRVLIYTGCISLPLYLFHSSFFRIAADQSLLQIRQLPGMMTVLAVFVALFVFCAVVASLYARVPFLAERAGLSLRGYLEGRPAGPRRRTPRAAD